MSILDNLKSYHRWLAALASDYELVISQFMIDEDWSYSTFQKKMVNCGTILLHHCAVGKGKKMSEQYEFITKIMLQTAKDWWLVTPMRYLLTCLEADESPVTPEPATRVKQMVAGLYLTYAMFKTKINRNDGIQIMLDSQDTVSFYYFRKCLVQTENIPIFVKKHIQFLLGDLYLDNAFEFTCESTMKGINPLIRLYNNVIRSSTAEINRDVKDWQYNYIIPVNNNHIASVYADYTTQRQKSLQKALGASSAISLFIDNVGKPKQDSELGGQDDDDDHSNSLMEIGHEAEFKYVSTSETFTSNYDYSSQPGASSEDLKTALIPLENKRKFKDITDDLPPEQSLLEMLASKPHFAQLAEASAVCHLLSDKPVHTIANVLGNNIADRAMMSESRKKMEKNTSRKTTGGTSNSHAHILGITDSEQHASNSKSSKRSTPYIQEGGIFGRKKTTEHKDLEKRGERTPIECSENLWSYIQCGMFDRKKTNGEKKKRLSK